MKRTCSLDLDNYSKSVELFNSFGIDLDDLCSNNVGILSGKPNHYKLLFKIDKPLKPCLSISICWNAL
jgi:hypothetical protein